MPNQRHHHPLDSVLDAVAHRYEIERLHSTDSANNNKAATKLVLAIESARAQLAAGVAPADATKFEFLGALSELIRESLNGSPPDPVYQALVLRHQSPRVREYAALSAKSEQNKRTVRTIVNAMAHPARQQRASSAKLASSLGEIHDASNQLQWESLANRAQHFLSWLNAELTISDESVGLVQGKLRRLLEEPALAELRRMTELHSDNLVQRYQALRDQSGPRSGSPDASERGAESKKRGIQTEVLAAQALQALADRLNRDLTDQIEQYRVVTSLRVPAALLADTRRGKGEWDSVLLYSSDASQGGSTVWEVCLLVEAKASADAATKDFPRLLRGLEILAEASRDATYAFPSREGTLNVSGRSLSTLSTDKARLRQTVMYCCDEVIEGTPRLLSAASRMQLLSAPASLDFATHLVNPPLGENANADLAPSLQNASALQTLEPVWRELLHSPNWRPVLDQYQTLLKVRELMVHPDDLVTAVRDVDSGRQ